MTEREWQPIETYERDAFDGEVVELRDEASGQEGIGSWGWDEEYWDGYTCAWHADGDCNRPLGFEPTHWRPQP